MPTTTPAYSSYQPTATQGYQASAVACHTVTVAHGILQGQGILWGGCNLPWLRDGTPGRERGLVGPRSRGLPLLSLGARWGQSRVWASQGCGGRTPGSRGAGRAVLVLGCWFETCCGCPRRLTSLSPAERGLTVAEHPRHLTGPPGGHHGLHGQPVSLHGLPALRHAGEGTCPWSPSGLRCRWWGGCGFPRPGALPPPAPDPPLRRASCPRCRGRTRR